MAPVNEATKENQGKQVFKYKKRSGTSAITGSLYRSHLISLILSRNLNYEMKFVLGCSVADIGVMDEICFRFLHKKNNEKSVAVFIKTKYTGHITDDDLNNPKSAFNLYKCYQSHQDIKKKFDNDPDALFEGKFGTITPYFVIYTPHQNKIKNQVAVSADDKIYADKVNSIISTGKNNVIFKVQSECLVNDLINAKIELISKTIAAYVSSDVKDRGEINNEMKNVLMKYHNFLIPHIIKVNELEENLYGEFNESLNENTNSHMKLLKEILFKEILKKSKVTEADASMNIQLLLDSHEYTGALLSTLVGTVITFDEYTKKLAYMPGVSDFIKQQPLDKIQVKKTLVDEAFVIAGMEALKCIRINFNDIGMREIITEQSGEQINVEDVFEEERKIADQFLKYLYIYSHAKQDKENDVSERLKEEIIKSQSTYKSTTIFHSKTEAVLIKFHFMVQKWMLCMDKPEYLTNYCDFLKDSSNIMHPHLSILNYNCMMELQQYSLKFKSESFDSFSKIDETQNLTNISSNDVLLTSIKLMQYFSDKFCLFVNFNQVYNMTDSDFNILLQEVNNAPVRLLVVIFYENNKHSTESDKFKQIVNSFNGLIVTVSKHHIKTSHTICDIAKGLEDIDYAHEFLKHEITFQGEKVELEKIVDESSINLINAGILMKVIKNESIVIGQNLSNSFYNEIKDCFIDRTLKDCDTPEHICECHSMDYYTHLNLKLKTSDFSEVVAIYAEPGMGKSTLLTHLSLKMKRAYPKKYIVKINLLNYCEDFFNWEEKVDIAKSMHLVCRAELNNKSFDKLFVIEKGSDGDLVLLESKELDPIASLHLKLIIHSFNTRNIIFLFDGFDEICPHYENTVVQFIKSFVNMDIVTPNNEYFHRTNGTDILRKAESKKQIFIASRSYNALKTTLEREFNIKTLYLTRLLTNEQYNFYLKYWETRIKLEELNADQFQNVEAFFEYMNQYHLRCGFLLRRSAISDNMLLRRMQEAAVYYFRSKVHLADTSINKETLLNKWILPADMITVDDSIDAGDYKMEDLQLTGIPLQMKIFADLFVHQIKDTSSTKKWDMGVHTFEFYNLVLEIKLKEILLEEKGGENVNTSAFLAEYEYLVTEVTKKHKELAFYAFFHNASSPFKTVLSDTQWMKIKSMVEQLKKAEEKTGLIDRIHNEVPRFVHQVFTEYYAVEYIADMLKLNPLPADQVNRQIDFVVNCLLKNSVGIMTAFNHKLKNDEELREVLGKDDIKKCIFTVWMEQDTNSDNKKKEGEIHLKKILESGLIETAWLLLTSVEDNLNSANIKKFVDTIGSDFFEIAMMFDIDDLIKYVLDAIRRVDPSMVVKALLNCKLQLGDFPDNTLILGHLRDTYPTRIFIETTPKFVSFYLWDRSNQNTVPNCSYYMYEV